MKRIGLVYVVLNLTWFVASSVAVAQPALVQRQVPQDPSAVGYLNLSKRHPDGSEGPVAFSREFAPDAALQRLDQVRGFLGSFKQLTMRARARLTAAELADAGNTSMEMQGIGFHNIPLVIEGTVLKQDYQLKQLEYELVQLRQARGEAVDEDVERARAAYAAATKRFQLFWDTKRPID